MPVVNPYRPVPGSTAARRAALRQQAATATPARPRRDPAPPRGPGAADRYGSDVLATDPHRVGPAATRPRSVEVAAEPGMVLEDHDPFA